MGYFDTLDQKVKAKAAAAQGGFDANGNPLPSPDDETDQSMYGGTATSTVGAPTSARSPVLPAQSSQADSQAAAQSAQDQALQTQLTQGTTAPNNDFSTPEAQLAWLTPRLQSAGFGGQESYWQQRINETGGFTPENLAYWEKNIATGQAGREPGGAYYDPAVAGASSAAAQTTGPYDAQISDEIQKLLADANTPTDENSPVVKNATDAYRNQVNYGTDRAREKMAEQAAYEGTGSGAFDTAIQSSLESGARDTASFQNTQITGELQRKADEIKTALSTASGANAQKLQLQLAQIQDQLSRAQMGQQNQQYYDKLSADIGSSSNDLDAELMKYLTQGGA